MSTIKQLLQKMNLHGKAPARLQPQSKVQDHEEHMTKLKDEMKKTYRPHWKTCGVTLQKEQFLRLNSKQLDNWQIERIPLSKRSYCFPKNFHGFNNSTVGTEFSSFDCKDKRGHRPFLYEGETAKLARIRSLIHKPRFQPINTAKGNLFGFRKMRYSLSAEKCHQKGTMA